MKKLFIYTIAACFILAACAKHNPTGPGVHGTKTTTPTLTMICSPTWSATITPTKTPVFCAEPLNLGYDGPMANMVDSTNGIFVYSTKFYLPYPAVITSLNAYAISPGGSEMNIGLYTETAGAPGLLITKTGKFTDTDGWNTVATAPINLNPGYYWLAVYRSEGYYGINYPTTGISKINHTGGTADLPGSNASWMDTTGITMMLYASYCLQPGAETYTSTATSTYTVTPTFTVTDTDTATITPTSTVVYCASPLFFGVDSASSVGNNHANCVAAGRYYLPYKGTITSISANTMCDPGEQVRAGIYTDQSGIPGILITQGEPVASQDNWMNMPVSPVELEPGWYWLAAQSTRNNYGVAFRVIEDGVTHYYKANTWGPLPSSMSGALAYGNTFIFKASFCLQAGVQTFTHTVSPTHSVTPTITETHTVSPTGTDSATVTATRTATATATPSRTRTDTATGTATKTASYTATFTATATPTATGTATRTASATVTKTITMTNTATNTPTATITRTHTASPTRTASPTITITSTATPYWRLVGDQSGLPDYFHDPKMKIVSGVIYATGILEWNNITLIKYSGGVWGAQSNSGYDPYMGSGHDMAVHNGNVYAATSENSDTWHRLDILLHNGTSWSQQASNLTLNTATHIKFAEMAGCLYVTAYDAGSNELKLFKQNGTAWNLIAGIAIDPPYPLDDSAAATTGCEAYVFSKRNTESAKIRKYNASLPGWESMGEIEFADESFSLLWNAGATYAAYKYSWAVVVREYNAGSWDLLGGSSAMALSANFQNLAAAAGSSGLYVAFDEGDFKGVTVKKWNGTSWSFCGPREFTLPDYIYDHNALQMAVDDAGVPYLAYISANVSRKLTVMEYR